MQQKCFSANSQGLCIKTFEMWFTISAQSGKECGCRWVKATLAGPRLLKYCQEQAIYGPPDSYYLEKK